MKRPISVLSVLLALALVLMTMPFAQAAEVSLQASGVLQAVKDEVTDTPFARVFDMDGALEREWIDPHDDALPVFEGMKGDYLKPTKDADKPEPYVFWLENNTNLLPAGNLERNKPIFYEFEFSVKRGTEPVSGLPYAHALPIAYKITREKQGSAAEIKTGAVPLAGTLEFDDLTAGVPAGEKVKFTLEWQWEFTRGVPQDGQDTGFGIQSSGDLTNALSRTPYAVYLEFNVNTRDRLVTLRWLDADGDEIWPAWPDIPEGMTIAEAMEEFGYELPPAPPRQDGYTFRGYRDKSGRLIVDENGELAEGAGAFRILADGENTAVAEMVLEQDWKKSNNWWPWIVGGGITIGAGGLVVGGLTLPWLIAIPAAPALIGIGWLLHKNCDKDCGKPGCPEAKPAYVAPPKTGDSWGIEQAAGFGIVLAAAVLLVMTKKRREEDLRAC